MSRSLIFTANSSNQSVLDGGVVNLGNIQRRYGNNCQLSGNAILVSGTGYYDISASFSVTPTAAGTVTITAYNGDIPVNGINATGTVAATDTTIPLSVTGVVRLFCNSDSSPITFKVSGGDVDISNAAVIVKKE